VREERVENDGIAEAIDIGRLLPAIGDASGTLFGDVAARGGTSAERA
jgi:hypothetical protein